MPLYRYTVTFRGPFPMDMLRHDQAFPRLDGSPIARSFDPEHRREVQTVELVGLTPPTRDRWSSFGCGCSEWERV